MQYIAWVLTASAKPPAKLSPLVLAPELLVPAALFLSGVPATPGLFGGAGGFFLSTPFGLFGGGGATFLMIISSRYALGAHPWTSESGRLTSHQPFPSLRTITTTSPAATDSSLSLCPAKSYLALHVGSIDAAAAGGGGGGGGRVDAVEAFRA
jgi:hypothetical protein